MKVAYGRCISVAGRIAVGEIRFITEKEYTWSARPAEGIDAEAARFLAARETVLASQRRLYQEALAQAGESAAAIFESHIAILHDETLLQKIRERMARKGANATNATRYVLRRQAEELLASEDMTVAERAADVRDVANLLLDALTEKDAGASSSEAAWPEDEGDGILLAAEDLTPSAVLQLPREALRGVILRRGSDTSHAAILLRGLGIPTLVGCEALEHSWEGKPAILDTEQGAIYVEPDRELWQEYARRQSDWRRKEAMLAQYRDLPSVTRDGRRIRICANIDTPEEAEIALENGAEGVGLLRTEFLFMDRDEAPMEEEQLSTYRQVVRRMKGRPVVIRTVDIGADKTPAYMNPEKERNPVLGVRAIRYCLRHPDFFKTQLRAVLRAAAEGEVILLFPLIADVREVRLCKEIVAECEQELQNEKLAYRRPRLGVMVETPAAALCADDLAQEVSYLSVGNNDLLQYTCAVDRDNPQLSALRQETHPALQKLVEMTVAAGHRHGCTVALCGEMGADLARTKDLLRTGVDEISVHPAAILPLRSAVRAADGVNAAASE